jgi:hypothetical protein
MTTENQLLHDLIAAYDADDGFALSIAVDALRAALTQPVWGGEAVAEVDGDICSDHKGTVYALAYLPHGTKLYTAPPANREQADAVERAVASGEFEPGYWTVSAERAIQKNPQYVLTLLARLKRLEASQEQAQQPSGGEVVAWLGKRDMDALQSRSVCKAMLSTFKTKHEDDIPLTLATPKPEPMTEEQMGALIKEVAESIDSFQIVMTHWPLVIRAVEAHFGITKEQA